MGDVTPRPMIQNVTRFGLYADQILIANPFKSPHTFSDDFNPIIHPELWLSDTLKLSYFLVLMAPWIDAGIVHLIPNPFDYDAAVRDYAIKSASARFKSPEYAEILEEIGEVEASVREEWERAFIGTPLETIESDLKQKGESEEAIADFLRYVEERRRTDPLYLDHPLGEHGEVIVQRSGMNLETGLYVARMTGAFPYTNMQSRWTELQLSKDELPESSDPWTPLSRGFDELEFDFLNDVPAKFAVGLQEDGRLASFRTFLRRVWRTVSDETDPSRMESSAREFSDELREEHRKAEAEWRAITNATTREAMQATGAAIVVGGYEPRFAIPGYGITLVAELLSLRARRRGFRDRVPMSVFVDLRRRKRA